MRKTLTLFVAATAALGAGAVAVAGSGGGDVKETLTGYEENMAISTPGVGEFRARIDPSAETISYTLSFSGIPTEVRQAHIHFEKRTNNGLIVAWLCDSTFNESPRATTPAPSAITKPAISPPVVMANNERPESKKPIAAPGKIACAMASPTRLIRRSIRNTPMGAAPSASAITAASARRMNSNSVKGAISAS